MCRVSRGGMRRCAGTREGLEQGPKDPCGGSEEGLAGEYGPGVSYFRGGHAASPCVASPTGQACDCDFLRDLTSDRPRSGGGYGEAGVRDEKLPLGVCREGFRSSTGGFGGVGGKASSLSPAGARKSSRGSKRGADRATGMAGSGAIFFVHYRPIVLEGKLRTASMGSNEKYIFLSPSSRRLERVSHGPASLPGPPVRPTGRQGKPGSSTFSSYRNPLR